MMKQGTCQSHCVRSGLPFGQVLFISQIPIGGSEGPAAFVHDLNGPGAQTQLPALGQATEIHIVEMKIESLIEAHALRQQGFTVCSQQQAVHDFHLYTRRAVVVDPVRGPALAMTDNAAEIFGRVASKGFVDKHPTRLARQASAVARETDDVEAVQPSNQPFRPEEVEQMNVIVNEQEYGRTTHRLAQYRVIDGRQSGGIVGEQPKFYERPTIKLQRS